MIKRRSVTYRINPSKHQIPIIEDILSKSHSIYVLAAGRQFGKTTLSQMIMTIFALSKPRSVIAFCAPKVKQCMRVYNEIIESPGFVATGAKAVANPQPTIKFPNGSRILFFPLEKSVTGALGFAFDLLVIDEVRDIKEKDFKVSLLPTIASKNGIALLLSTFKSKEHWFTKIYDAGQKPNKAAIKSYKCPSSMGYPFEGPDGAAKLARLREAAGETAYKVECECECLQTGDNVFKAKFIDDAIKHRSEMKYGGLRAAILDMGKKNDPASIIVTDSNLNIIHEEVFELGTDYTVVTDGLKRVAQAHNCQLIGVDTNGTNADSVVDFMRPRLAPFILVPVPMRTHNKEQYIKSVILKFENGKIKIPTDCTILQNQCRNLEYKNKGDYQGFVNPNGHDDLVACLAMASAMQDLGYFGGINTSMDVPDDAIISG